MAVAAVARAIWAVRSHPPHHFVHTLILTAQRGRAWFDYLRQEQLPNNWTRIGIVMFSTPPFIQPKLTLTLMMVLDYVGCWFIENICKYLFANLEPRALITKGRERRDQRRLEEAKKAS